MSEKKKARRVFKLLKSGILKYEDLTEEEKKLLKKYYWWLWRR